jgi:predicted dehydrogenase
MTSDSAVAVGLIGCGTISGVYLRNCRKLPHLDVIACADLDLTRARARAREFNILRVSSVEELLADPKVELVLNLTVPSAHASVSIAALEAGKHVYSEKPLATSHEDGRGILARAEEANRMVGCAPDTFMGAGMQTARYLIDQGVIGQPAGATAFFLGRGMEHWHPDPAFFYQPGAGPLFDMGPYYLTALVSLLGEVRSVTGMARITVPERTITSPPLAGRTFKVTTPTFVAGVLEFVGGPLASLITTFDVRHQSLPNIEVYGSEGTLRVPDPNRYDGPVLIRRSKDADWHTATSDSPYVDNWRGIGLDDMARAILTGGSFGASGALGLHVLEVMETLLASAAQGRRLDICSRAERPSPLRVNVVIDA